MSIRNSTTTRRVSRLAAGLLAAALATVPPAAAPADNGTRLTGRWKVTTLPELPGGKGAVVTGADRHGTLFGTATAADGKPHLVSWHRGRLRDLDGTHNWATALGNRHGTIVGTVAPADGTHHAARYAGGRVTMLPEPPGTLSTGVIALDDRGNAVGQASGFDWQVHAVLWPADHPGTVELLSVPPGMGSGGAFAIGSAAMAADGTRILGYAGVTGYVWGLDGSIAHTVLPTAPGDALNLLASDHGVAVGTQWREAEGVNHAITVDRALRVRALPDSRNTVAFTGTEHLVGGQDSATLAAICWMDGRRTTLPVPAGTRAGYPRVTSGPRSLAGLVLDSSYTRHAAQWVLSGSTSAR